MAKLYRIIAKAERDHDFEVAAWSAAEVGLDDAAGSGDVVAFTGDPRSAVPRPEVVAGIVAKPMPQLFTLYDDCLKITVAAASEVGLNETDVSSGHLDSPFPVSISRSRIRLLATVGGGERESTHTHPPRDLRGRPSGVDSQHQVLPTCRRRRCSMWPRNLPQRHARRADYDQPWAHGGPHPAATGLTPSVIIR